jgi:iron complex transport system substrate-binding protein
MKFVVIQMRLSKTRIFKRSIGLRPTAHGRLFFSFWLLACGLCLLGGSATICAATHTHWVTDETGRTIEVPLHPQRIISIAPSVTEILYALGLEARIVGRSDYCDYPPQARQKPSVGGLINPNVETMVSMHPDLVMGTPEINKITVADQLARFRIPLYGVHANTLDDVLQSLKDVGALTDSQSRADDLVRLLQGRREAVVHRVRGLRRPRVLFLIWYSPISVPGRGSFLNDVVLQAGGQSISSDLKQDWSQMSLEEIVRRDPEIILVPTSNESSPPIDKLKTWPGWSATTAARTNRIIAVGDSANRPSPRLFDALEEFAAIFHPKEK